ncbi:MULTISPECIES: hypothetical protein [unclassified Corallococcus]|uniref:hypothetical protein n=1 Tax=unclassified Corallococcus TaxID=2685029 RepID=UPI001A8E38BE|nr:MULTISPECIES: hypothetical protein [unclassified Corallococcus]MBN9683461.1 hypothetical protein [Corallococcus sp. NCSPR001]WAS85022.1 hypothetical protein O0N60_37915 [Corallococcus sp. NCRR]
MAVQRPSNPTGLLGFCFPRPATARILQEDAPETCPAGLQCFLELGCIVTWCPKAGAGSGCPANGFCYTIDSNPEGYCTRLCETDTDCTAVNPDLICRERSSTEPSGKKICILP